MLGPKSLASASGSATGNPRNKVALKPGHSLMDWIRLGNSGQDLTGVKGVLQEVSLDQLAKHNKRTDAWLAIRGKVYNVTHYLDFHPGGQDELMRGVGKDATELFNQIHAWVNYDSILQKCIVGRLKRRSDNNEDLAVHLFGNKKTDDTFLVPTGAPVPKASITPTMPRVDWFQQLGSVTLSFYTRSACPQVRVCLHNGHDVSVRIRMGRKAFLAHYILEGVVTWPCRIEARGDSGKVEVQLFKTTPELWNGLGTPCEDNGVLSEAVNVCSTFLLLDVVSVVAVTYNTKLMVLRHRDETYDRVPLGHHVLVRSEVEGVEVVRRYTPVPPALHRDYIPDVWQRDCLCLMVKCYPMGALTPWLCDLQPGQNIAVSEPEGEFRLQMLASCTHLYLVAAGTGLTPMLGLIEWALDSRNKKCQKVSLMFLNRTQSDILWCEQMDRLVQEDNRFLVVHVLSDAGADWPGPRGRMDLLLLQSFLPTTLPDPNSPTGCFICVCGPTPFTELTHTLLEEMGYSESHYHCFMG